MDWFIGQLLAVLGTLIDALQRTYHAVWKRLKKLLGHAFEIIKEFWLVAIFVAPAIEYYFISRWVGDWALYGYVMFLCLCTLVLAIVLWHIWRGDLRRTTSKNIPLHTTLVAYALNGVWALWYAYTQMPANSSSAPPRAPSQGQATASWFTTETIVFVALMIAAVVYSRMRDDPNAADQREAPPDQNSKADQSDAGSRIALTPPKSELGKKL